MTIVYHTKQVDALRAELELSRKIADEAIKQTEILTKQLDEWEEKEAACCPEDFGFEEVIKSLQTKLDVAISTLLYYRASGTNDWAEKALAKINKIGGVNE